MPVTLNRDLPLNSDRSRDWDGDGARRRMGERCSRGDELMTSCMGQGFVWRDADANASTLGAYKLPVADVIDGELQIVFAGVAAAARSVSPEAEPGQARALEASESELDEMRSALASLYRRFAEEFDDEEIRAPWERDSTTASAQGNSCGCDCTCAATTAPASEDAEVSAPPAEEAPVSQAPVPDPVNMARDRVLRASAGSDWRPPTEWFANPKLDGPTKITVAADGRVYGHLAAPWDTPHIGYDGTEIYPPRDADGGLYRGFRRSEVITADGMTVYCGLITMSAGHADPSMGFTAAQDHYDNTCSIVAAVNVGEDAHGIWLAGSMLPDVTAEQRTRFSLASISGDWRRPKPGMPFQLIAALSVPNPGFPVLHSDSKLSSDRFALAASAKLHSDNGELVTIIASGTGVIDQGQIDMLAKAVGDVVDARLAAWEQAHFKPESPAADPVAPAAEAADDSASGEAEPGADETAAVPEAEASPAPEGEPAPEGTAAPIPAPAQNDAGAPAAPSDETASSGGAAAPEGSASLSPAPPEDAPAPAPTAEQIAAAAQFLGRVRPAPARPSALERVLAAAGGGGKKA